jgi:cytochrome P450
MNLFHLKCVEEVAKNAADELGQYLLDLVADRKIEIETGKAADNFLNRMIKINAASLNPVSDEEIVRIIGGTIVGTAGISKAFGQAIDQLLDRPFELKQAQAAAQAGDRDTVAAYVFEALRFNPQNPILLRNCDHAFVLSSNHGHHRVIPVRTKVICGIVAAMSDPTRMVDPKKFMFDRPPQDYLHFGVGPHACFGRLQAETVIPEMAMALLKEPNLRRAGGRTGQLKYDGAFPARLILEFRN